jgi:hypothetical protein
MTPNAGIPPSTIERAYLTIGLFATGLLGLCLVERGTGPWLVLPPMVAAAGLYFRWLRAPVFVLLGSTIAVLIAQRTNPGHLPVADAMLSATLIGYVAAHYRLCSFGGTLYPPDSRRLLRPKPPGEPALPGWLEFLMLVTVVPYIVYSVTRKPRSPGREPEVARPRRAAAAPDEIPRLLISAALAPLAALGLWLAVRSVPVPLRIWPSQWRLGLSIWFFFIAVCAVAGLAGYFSLRRMSLLEARLRLHDALWSETRAEQRSVARWIRWRRLRHPRPPEGASS